MTHAASTNGSATAALPAREMGRFLAAYRREHATTEKVLRAFPPEQADLRPHERSSAARQVAWTFVVEERMMLLAVRNELVLGKGFTPPPESWGEIVDAFAAQHEELLRQLEGASDADLQGTVRFYVAPRQTGDIPRMDFLWFMLHDQIHHRGQLSVYLRMAGGKVPSIYGPSADEPWT
jgi:uncharacterized damage-inducible protein DinB